MVIIISIIILKMIFVAIIGIFDVFNQIKKIN
jgi:hypothetical protein